MISSAPGLRWHQAHSGIALFSQYGAYFYSFLRCLIISNRYRELNS